MPPAAGPKLGKPPTSRELVTTGPKAVSGGKNLWAGIRDKDGRKPTTSRALVLRNGKYGSMGTGELVHMGKMSGREKLELLAEDLVERAKTAVAPPFDLERCLRIADSECNAYLDDITTLKDPALFRHYIESEVKARATQAGDHSSPTPKRIAEITAISVHNAYMFASIWKMVRDQIVELHELGFVDSASTRNHLRRYPELRQHYLVLYDILSALVNAGLQNFQYLVTTAPHYQQYFKTVDTGNPDEKEVAFDWAALKGAYKSFLDSIVLELCFPNSRIPRRVLLQILGEAATESPKEAKRFPQALWDAVGDLSVAVDVLETFEGPILGPDLQARSQEERTMPEAFLKWEDAQVLSAKAIGEYENLKDLVYPLEKTKNRRDLDVLWTQINNNYTARAGKVVDVLWQLHDAFVRHPQWNAFYKENKKPKKQTQQTQQTRYNSDSDSDSDVPPLATVARKKNTKQKPLTITNGYNDDSDGSMPSLQSVSDSSDEEESSDDDYDEFDDDESDWEDEDEESQYDSDEEEEIKYMMKEAMNAAMEMPEFLDPKAELSPEFDKLAEERADNPFLKLLSSLRGRMFSTKPNVTTTSRTDPRTPFAGARPATAVRPTGPPQPAPRRGPDDMPPLEPIPPRGMKATVEEVEDEEHIAARKKKKKKPKKKKPAASTAKATDNTQAGQSAETASVATPPPASPSPLPSVTESPQSPKKKKKKKRTGPTAALASPTNNANTPSIHSLGSTATLAPGASTTSLPTLYQTQTAQSARSYAKEQGLDEKKEKVKSRPEPGSLQPIQEKKGLFGRLSTKDKPKEEVNKKAKSSFFSQLGRKTTDYMHQLLRTSQDDKKGKASMKWDNFVKLMTDMGFSYNPSTAGSSVRFDPPDDTATPITFHKPHPDPTIDPVMLRKFAKRLKKYYGWSEEDFLSNAAD